jgi:hypothetical protein
MNRSSSPATKVTQPPTSGRRERARKMAAVVRDVADRLRAAREGGDPQALKQLTMELRDVASSLDNEAAAPAVAAGRVTPAGGPGGLGYLLALTPDEEAEIDWGAKNAS